MKLTQEKNNNYYKHKIGNNPPIEYHFQSDYST